MFLLITVFLICLILILLLFSILIFKFTREHLNTYQNIFKRRFLFLRYKELTSILDQSKDIAFHKVFQENLLTNISSGYRLNEEEAKSLGSEFVKMTLNCCGPLVTRDLVDLFGDYDSLCLFLMTGFINKTIETESQLLSIAVDENTEVSDIHNAILDNIVKGV